jgi:hypothetical protein
MPWCLIDWSQNGALADAVPEPRVFVHDVPCPEAAEMKTTRLRTIWKILDGMIRWTKEWLKLVYDAQSPKSPKTENRRWSKAQKMLEQTQVMTAL